MKTKERLANNRSPRWAFLERFEIPDYDDPDSLYMTRWRIIHTPLFGLYLHRFDGPDPRPTLHDHPYNFISLILRGGYTERRLDNNTLQVNENRRVRFINKVSSRDAHAIMKLHRTPTWSLLLVGRRTRKWGYLEPLGNNAWLWTPFDKHRHADEFDRAMNRRHFNQELIKTMLEPIDVSD